MNQPNNPSYTSWIEGAFHGQSYRLRFIDRGHPDSLELELNIRGLNANTCSKVPRANSVRYEKTHSDDLIDKMLHNILAELQ